MTMQKTTITNYENREIRPYDAPAEYREVDPFKMEAVDEIIDDVIKKSDNRPSNLTIDAVGDYDAVLRFMLDSYKQVPIEKIAGKTQEISICLKDSLCFVDILITDFSMDKAVRYR